MSRSPCARRPARGPRAGRPRLDWSARRTPSSPSLRAGAAMRTARSTPEPGSSENGSSGPSSAVDRRARAREELNKTAQHRHPQHGRERPQLGDCQRRDFLVARQRNAAPRCHVEIDAVPSYEGACQRVDPRQSRLRSRRELREVPNEPAREVLGRPAARRGESDNSCRETTRPPFAAWRPRNGYRQSASGRARGRARWPMARGTA